MTKYIAMVKNKKTKRYTLITTEEQTKAQFAKDLRANGYAVRLITTEEKYDEDCEKYADRLERQCAIQRAKRRVAKERCI